MWRLNFTPLAPRCLPFRQAARASTVPPPYLPMSNHCNLSPLLPRSHPRHLYFPPFPPTIMHKLCYPNSPPMEGSYYSCSLSLWRHILQPTMARSGTVILPKNGQTHGISVLLVLMAVILAVSIPNVPLGGYNEPSILPTSDMIEDHSSGYSIRTR